MGGIGPFETDTLSGKASALSVTHRLAILYLMTPVVIWLVGWHEWWLGIAAVALLALALWRPLSGSWRKSPSPAVIALLVVAAGWVTVTAAGGVFDVHNFDWIKHRAIFLSLSREDWPVYVPTYLETPALLRYYLGYYMAPGLIANRLGAATLNWMVPLWTWCGVALLLLLFTRHCHGWKVFAAAAILIFFSGMDIVRTVLFDGLDWFAVSIDLQGWPRVWLGQSDLPTGTMGMAIHYRSHMKYLMWVPQHFIAGGLYALLLVQLRREPYFLAVSGVLLATSLFWSVFIAIGLAPLAVALLVTNGIQPFLRWQNLFLALPLAGLLAAYLSSGSINAISHGWVWNTYLMFWPRAPGLLPIVYITEFLLLAILAVWLRPQLLRSPFFIACVTTLLLLPWYSVGKWNDLLSGAIPAYVLLAYYSANTITGFTRETSLRIVPLAGAIVVLAVGIVAPLFGMVSASNDRDLGLFRYERLGPEYSLLHVLSSEFLNQYAAYEVPNWYRGLLRDTDKEAHMLAKGERIASSAYDVYLTDKRLIYIREKCDETEDGSRFFLHVFPLDAKDLPANREHATLDFDFKQHGWRIGEQCVVVKDLPAFAIGRIRTGQYNTNRTSPTWIIQYSREAYRSPDVPQ